MTEAFIKKISMAAQLCNMLHREELPSAPYFSYIEVKLQSYVFDFNLSIFYIFRG